jgi:hypothetical protein
MRTWILAPLLAVAACASPVKEWTHDTAATSRLDQDKAQCDYEAKAATASYSTSPSDNKMSSAIGTGIGDGIAIAEKRIELINECMKVKGYRPAR